jgi:phospholipase/lecithinase/hemolysin
VETASQFAADIGSIVDTLQAKGAENIIVWTAPNLGLSPAITANGPAAASLATTLTYSMNAALAARLASETDVRTFDFFGLITSVNANPGAYGLTNVSDAGGLSPAPICRPISAGTASTRPPRGTPSSPNQCTTLRLSRKSIQPVRGASWPSSLAASA